MADFGTIQTRVQRNIIDLPTAVQAAIPDLINAAQRELQATYNFQVMKATFGPLLTAAGIRDLDQPLPENFKEARGRPYVLREDGTVRKIIWGNKPADTYPRYNEQPENTGEPRVLLVGDPTDERGNAGLIVYPYPDALSDYGDGNYRVMVPYWKFLTDLAVAGDTNWFTIHAADFLEYYASAEGFLRDWDEERAMMWLQRAQPFKARAIKQDKLQVLSQFDTLVPHLDANQEMLD